MRHRHKAGQLLELPMPFHHSADVGPTIVLPIRIFNDYHAAGTSP